MDAVKRKKRLKKFAWFIESFPDEPIYATLVIESGVFPNIIHSDMRTLLQNPLASVILEP